MDLTSLPLFATPGTLELAVILLIAVLLFGANKIPKLARSTGQAMGEFQRGREEIEDELEDMREGASLESSEGDTGTQTTTETTTTESADTSEPSDDGEDDTEKSSN
jgi:sec-independent protein translocase protein TatA